MVFKIKHTSTLAKPKPLSYAKQGIFHPKSTTYNIKYMYKADFLHIFSKNVWSDKKLYLYLRAEKPKRVERN